MRPETISKLCCPFDKADLALTTITKDVQGNILEGFFNCGKCQRIYPIVKGIPIMSPDEYRETTLELPLLNKWKEHMNGKSVHNFRLVEKASEESQPKK